MKPTNHKRRSSVAFWHILPPCFRKYSLLLFIFIAMIWAIAGLLVSSGNAPFAEQLQRKHWKAGNPDATLCEPGPWGMVHYTTINVIPPDSLFTEENTKPKETVWFFKEYTEENLYALIEKAGLSEEQKILFHEKSRREVVPEGISIFPHRDLILTINPEARARIYKKLGQFEENPDQESPLLFPPDFLNKWKNDPSILPKARELFEQLCYRFGSQIAFSDVEALVAELETQQARTDFYKALSRQKSLFPKLYISEGADIENLAAYWMKGSNSKDIRPLLQALSRRKGGYDLDLVHLLPPIPRKLVYTYPLLDENYSGYNPDCHWTSLNFFSTRPKSFSEIDINESHYIVSGKPTFGDIIFFAQPDMSPVHTCIYIADDIVFTKNGQSIWRPWIFMKLQDVINLYNFIDIKPYTLRQRKK